MADKIKKEYVAKFRNGKEVTRKSKNEYTHAYRITFNGECFAEGLRNGIKKAESAVNSDINSFFEAELLKHDRNQAILKYREERLAELGGREVFKKTLESNRENCVVEIVELQQINR